MRAIYVGNQSLLWRELCLALCIYLPKRNQLSLIPFCFLILPGITTYRGEVLQDATDAHIALVHLQGITLAASLVGIIASIFGRQDKITITVVGNINHAVANTGFFFSNHPVVAHLQCPRCSSTLKNSTIGLDSCRGQRSLIAILARSEACNITI